MKRFDWVLCPNCRHKLFKVYEGCSVDGLEVKCSSCKSIIVVSNNVKEILYGERKREEDRSC